MRFDYPIKNIYNLYSRGVCRAKQCLSVLSRHFENKNIYMLILIRNKLGTY